MAEDNKPYLLESPEGLLLTDGRLIMCPDFKEMIPRIKKGIVGTELLVRAARFKDMSGERLAIDATAGMGEDSLLLAAAGFRVRLFEYDHIIAELLKDALRRASDEKELAGAAARMEVSEGDSIEAMKRMAEEGLHPDVIYLDPMFPESSKNAMIKKKFQLLRQLEVPCTNEEELLGAAVAAAPAKIVIKRPVKGPTLAGCRPSYTIAGKAVRYDVLVFPENMKKAEVSD